MRGALVLGRGCGCGQGCDVWDRIPVECSQRSFITLESVTTFL